MSEKPWLNIALAQYGFEQWPQPDAGPVYRHVINYLPMLGQWPDTRDFTVLQGSPLPPALLRRDYRIRPGGGPDRLMQVAYAECADGHGARECLAIELGGSMLGNWPRGGERGIEIGELCFVGPGEMVTSVLSVRHNLQLSVRSIGYEDVSVAELAARLDQRLLGPPPASDPPTAPRILRFDAAASQVARGTLVPLRFEYKDRDDARLTVWLSGTAGPFERKDGWPCVHAIVPGAHRLEMTLASQDGRTASRSLEFAVS